MGNVLLAIEVLITAVAPLLHAREQPGERGRLARRSADAGRLGRLFNHARYWLCLRGESPLTSACTPPFQVVTRW